MGVFIGGGEEILGFLPFFSNFLSQQRLPQRLADVDESARATSGSRYAPALARTRQRTARLSPPSRPPPAPPIAYSAGGSRAVAGATAPRCRLAPLSPPYRPGAGDTAPPPARVGTSLRASLTTAIDRTAIL